MTKYINCSHHSECRSYTKFQSIRWKEPSDCRVSMRAGIAGSNPAQATAVSILWVVVCCVGSGLCDELKTHAEQCYRVCVRVRACLIVCELETSTMRRPRSEVGCSATKSSGKRQHSSTLKVEATSRNRTFIPIYQITRCHIPEHSNLQLQSRSKNFCCLSSLVHHHHRLSLPNE